MVKFISYDGAWPCLCQGTLVLEVNGKEVSLQNCLTSGGYVSWSDGDIVAEGPWTVHLPKSLGKYKDEITQLVNESIPWGCCGGCI